MNHYDSGGTFPISYCNGDRNPLFIGYYGFGGGGGGGGYSGGGNSQYEDIFEEFDAIADATLDKINEYAQNQQNEQLQNGILLIEGVETLKTTYDSVKDTTVVKVGKFASKTKTSAKLIRTGIGLYCAPLPSMADEVLGTCYIFAGMAYSALAWWEAGT